MIIGIFWLVSTILAWFLFVSFFLFLFSSFLPFLFFVVCVLFIYFLCMFISLGDFILLVFSLALYFNCLLLYFIQYFCIIKKKGTISFISTICHFYLEGYVCMYTLSLIYCTRIFVKTLTNILWQPMWEKNLKKNEYMSMYNWITLLYTWN